MLSLVLRTKCYLEKGDLRFLGTSEKCGKLTKYVSFLVEAVRYVTVVSLNLIRYANGNQCNCLAIVMVRNGGP